MNEKTPQPAPTRRIGDSIRTVPLDSPFVWLAKGWIDLSEAPWLSIMYGLFFSLIGLGLAVGLHMAGLDYLIYPLTAAVILGGPILALGIFAISRRLEHDNDIKIGTLLTAWRHNRFHVLTAGFVFMLFALVWSRAAVLTFVISFPYIGMNLDLFFEQELFTLNGLIFILVGTAIGAFLATIAFIIGVVSLPMLLDRKVDFLTAAIVSFLVVKRNKAVMITWAALIALFIGVGLVTLYIGLAVTLPLIGYASWHAYRECVDADAWPQTPID